MLTDPSSLSAISALIERTINEALNYDPGSQNQLSELSGKSVHIQINDLHIEARLRLLDRGVYFGLVPLSDSHKSSEEHTADLSLEGTLSSYVSLMREPAHTLSGSGVEARGQISLLESLHSISKQLDIDWEDALAQRFGSTFAGVAGQTVHLAKGLIQSAASNTSAQAYQFSLHESTFIKNNFVNKNEFSKFSQDIVELRQAADRLEAKINLITQK